MKRMRLLMVGGALCVLSSLGLAGIVHAQSISQHIEKNQTVNGSVYAAGEQVTIHGTVNGDVHCAAQEVIIDGTVNGDVLCAGQKVTVRGVVTGSVRAAGQEVEVFGRIEHGATVAGQRITVHKEARVGQDMTLAGSQIIFNGAIGRDLVLTGNQAVVDGDIGRNVRYDGAALKLQEGALIGGSLHYVSRQNVDKASGSEIKGEITHKVPENNAAPFGMGTAMALGLFAALLVLYMALVLVFPRQLHKTASVAVDSLGKTLLIGLAAMFGVPLLIGLVASTIIGIPLALVAALAALLGVLFSGPVAAYYFGSMLLSKSKNPVHIMLLGSTVVLLAGMVPIIGPIVIFVAYLIGSGALIIAAKRAIPKPVYRV